MKTRIPSASLHRLFIELFLCLILNQTAWSQAPGGVIREFSEKIAVVGVSAEQEQIRRAVTMGAAYLLRQTESDPFVNLFVPPARVGVVLGTEEVERRFARRTRTVPEYEYETYNVTVKDRYGEDVVQTRRRPVRQIGTREEEYLVEDATGDVVKRWTVPSARSREDFQGGGGYMPGTLGQNGLALYALFKAGVPADTGRLSHVVEDLVDHLHTFGLPDDTWDLSWLAAGLSVVPEPGDLLVVLLYEVMQARLGPERLQGLGSLDGALLQDQLFSDQP